MITFILSLAALVLGYIFYGRFVERVFGPDDRVTPAVSKADGLDYIVMPGWKIFMIQFLNIAGTGPIFGAIMGAKFGPAAYLWIVFGCIAMLIWQIGNPDGFNTIWQYFGWSNQALSVFTLWTVTVYLVRQKKNFWIMLIPALFMTTVCSTYVFISRQMLHLPEPLAYGLGIACLVVAAVWFTIWYNKQERNQQ